MDSADFLFPFPPYDIQKKFMVCLYECLDKEKLGIFESPTGTGKTMSIICGALKWLLDHENQNKEYLLKQISELDGKSKEVLENSSGDWFSDQAKQITINEEKRVIQAKLDALERRAKRREKFEEILKCEIDNKNRSKHFYSALSKKSKTKCDTEISQSDELNDRSNTDEDLLLEDFVPADDLEEDESTVDDAKYTQLLLCSRTHSQLAQFIGELKRSPYVEKVAAVPLASRQNYCINETVKKLGSLNLINEKCLQLHKAKKTTHKGEKDLKKSKISNSCPYNPGNQSLLVADVVVKIQDIEEIVANAKKTKTCPYYASKKSLLDSQVILLPYNSLLHKSTRLNLGINLKNNIIVIDEAHNLLEAIERMHSTTVTGRNILHCYSQLVQYQRRFSSKFSPNSVLHLDQLNFCLKKFLKILGGTTKSQSTDNSSGDLSPKIYTIEKFETTSEIDTVNIFDLLEFIRNSKLVHKLQGFSERYGSELTVHSIQVSNKKKQEGVTAFLNALQAKEKLNDSSEKSSNVRNENIAENNTSNSPLQFVANFLDSLKSSCSDGRIFVTPGPTVGQGVIKFLLMNPASHFSDIVKDARSVVLAGGTMEPISEFRDQLFIAAGAQAERITTFSCNHVVPKENILTRIVMTGPSGVSFDFSYKNRQSTLLLDELGRTLVDLVAIVPGGIVLFLPSYSYEESLYKHLETSGVIEKISKKKKVFREPKLASLVNSVLENFSESIIHPKNNQTGSLLFSVVGGKLSEGLNFSDNLGRCIVVVGMPYPNIKSPELQEKIKYLNENVRPNAGHEYYENCCIKAVNQCIGRAVRHINDYATVILLDKRYSNKCKSLPGWIQRTLTISNEFKDAKNDVAQFFFDKDN